MTLKLFLYYLECINNYNDFEINYMFVSERSIMPQMCGTEIASPIAVFFHRTLLVK